MGYKEKVAMATMMESMGKKKKKAQLRKDIEEAKKQGFDVTIKYDPATGEYAPTFSYKQPTKTQAEKDAEITEMFQQDAQQAYGGGLAGVSSPEITNQLNAPARGGTNVSPGVRGMGMPGGPLMNREKANIDPRTGKPVGVMQGLQQAEQFRKPFDAAGQTMRPGASGKFAPVNIPGRAGGPAGPTQNQIMQLAEKLATQVSDQTDAQGNFIADTDTRPLGEKIKDKIAIAKALYQATGGQVTQAQITGQKDSYGYSLGETMLDENDANYVYIGNDQWELVEE